MTIVADNFFETCLLIIGIYYYDEHKFSDAIKIFELILPILDMKESLNETAEHTLQVSRVRALLVGLYFIQARIEHDAGRHREAINLLTKIPQRVPYRIPVLILLARCHYLVGDFYEAQSCTKEIRAIEKRHPAVALNNAFFGIKQKNYERTRFWYDELLKLNALKHVDLFSVITFLDEDYQKDVSEHAFLYGLGVVNGYIDRRTRKSNLQRFLRLTKNRPEYEVLRKRAQELLGERDR